MLIVISFLLIFVLESARRRRNELLVLEYQYKFFALRDELREYAMEDPKIAQNWVFQYLDSTIARTIKVLPRISIWYVIGLWLAYRKDRRLDRAQRHLEQEYRKAKNQKHKELEEKCVNTLASFMLSRHIILTVVSVLALVLPAACGVAIREARRRSLELVVESPETSTLLSFVPV
jgi:hypothetical protein